jgi:ABC-type glycerol-3-phosphate transport system substrate-binding protein
MNTKKAFKLLVLLSFAVSFLGCSSKTVPQNTFTPILVNPQTSAVDNTNSETIVISCPIWNFNDPFIERREELLSRSGINAKIKYYPVYNGADDYLINTKTSIAAGDDIDAYILLKDQATKYETEYATPDLTDDLREYAPDLLRLYQDLGIQGPYYELPLAISYFQEARYGIAVAKELVDKYSLQINSINDYYDFLTMIKNNEKGCIPGMLDSFFSLETLLASSGYVDAGSYMQSAGNRAGIYFQPSNPSTSLNYLENIPECVSAFWKVKQLLNNNTFVQINKIDSSSNPIASIPISLSDTCLDSYVYSFLSQQIHNMIIFPVEKGLMYNAMSNDVEDSIVLSPNTSKIKDVMRFVDWILKQSDHYMFAKYGEKDKDYVMNNEILSPIVQNSATYYTMGISWALGIHKYEPKLFTYPVNAYDVINTIGTSNDTISRLIGSDPSSFLKLRDELDNKLYSDTYFSLLKKRESALNEVLISKTGDHNELESALSNIQKDGSLLDLYRDYINRINNIDAGN